jgi:hypothetical protein
MTKSAIYYDKIKTYYLSLLLEKNNSSKYHYFVFNSSSFSIEHELDEIIEFYAQKYYNLLYYRKCDFAKLVSQHYPKISSPYNFSDKDKNIIFNSRKNFKKDFIEANNIVNRDYPLFTCEISTFTILEYLESIEKSGYCIVLHGNRCENIKNIIHILSQSWHYENNPNKLFDVEEYFFIFFNSRFLVTNAAKKLLISKLSTGELSSLSTDEKNFLMYKKEKEEKENIRDNIFLDSLIDNYLLNIE